MRYAVTDYRILMLTCYLQFVNTSFQESIKIAVIPAPMKSGAGIQNKAWRLPRSLGVQDTAGLTQEKMEVWGADSDSPLTQRLT
jgi:hypothetical protein